MTDLGGCVRRVREQMGITGAQMAIYALGEAASGKARRAYVDRLSKLERSEEGHTNPTLDRLELLAKGMRLSLPEFIIQVDAFGEQRYSRKTEDDLTIWVKGDRTARTPEESVQRTGAKARPATLDASTLLKAGNALVDAGGLFIAAAHGVAVAPQPRARADDSARRRAPGPRRRAGGNR